MYSYREFLDMQSKRLMSSDERLEKKNRDIIRFCVAENNRAKKAQEADIKIYNGKEKKPEQCRCGRHRHI